MLGHFGTVVHYTGAVRPGNATQLQLRAFLNEGGKLIEAGELAGGTVDLGGGTLSNDFSQYYLGAYSRTSTPGATGFTGSGKLGGATGGPRRRARQPAERGRHLRRHLGRRCPPRTYPQFAQRGRGPVHRDRQPVRPYAGSYMAAAVHTDDAYKRLTRTIDLTGVGAADKPTLRTQLLWDTEPGYDHAVVEAHTVGGRRLDHASRGGRRHQRPPSRRVRGRLLRQATTRSCTHYLTLDAAGCTAHRAPAAPGTASPAPPAAGSRSTST